MPAPSGELAPFSAEAEVGDIDQPDALVEVLSQEPTHADALGAAAIAATEPVDAVAVADAPLSAASPAVAHVAPMPPQPHPAKTRPAIVAAKTAPVSEPTIAPVAVGVAAQTRSPAPSDEAPPAPQKPSFMPVGDPATAAMPQDAPVVAQAVQAPAFKDAVPDAPSPASQLPAATAESRGDESSQAAVPAIASMNDLARTGRARTQGASVLDYLTRRKPNAPPIWHSGSAFDQAEQARRTLTAGRSARPARPLYELEQWHFGAQHAEARIPVEPSDRRLDTQIVRVRMLWKNDDWWVETIGLETAK